MKVDGPQSANKAASGKKARRSGESGGAGFADALRGGEAADGAGETGRAEGGSGVASVDALLSVQEVDDAADRPAKRQAARDWGAALLDRLDDIRAGLLAGRIPADRLQALGEALARERERTDDPDLQGVLKEIEVRARVELAKHGRS